MKFSLPYDPTRAVHRAVYAATTALLASVFFKIGYVVLSKPMGVGGLLVFFCWLFCWTYFWETRRVRRWASRVEG